MILIVKTCRSDIIDILFYLCFKRVDGLLHCVWVGAEVGVDV